MAPKPFALTQAWEDRKGERIRFLKGTYKGGHGWYDVEGKKTEVKVWVLVSQPEAMLIRTQVNKDSISEWKEDDDFTYETAVLDQHPDIASQMHVLCIELAKCNIHDAKPMAKRFEDMLTEAIRKQQTKKPRHVEDPLDN